MAEQTHSVVYRAIAEFDDARKKAREFRDELRALKTEQETLNRTTASGTQQAEQSQRRLTGATEEHARVTRDNSKAISESVEQTRRLGAESDRTSTKFRNLRSIGNNFGTEMSKYLRSLSEEMRRTWREADKGEAAFTKLRRAISTSGGGGGGTGFFTILAGGADALGRSITSVLSKFTFWPTIILAAAAAAGPLVAILGSLGAVALGAASNLVSLAGTVAALPGLVFAAASGIGALVTAIAPLGGALKAYQAAQDASAASAGRSGAAAQQQAERIRSAARGVEQANRGVTEAERGVEAARRAVTAASRGVEEAHYGVAQAAREVEDAEYNLAEANYDARRAQLAVNEARQDALRDLQDLRREVDRSSLTEERAVLSLVRAQTEYARVMADPTSSMLDRREATLRLREAENDLSDVRRKNADNAKELNEAEKKGVEGSDRVVDAKKAAEEAARRQRDAELAVIDAQRGLVQANLRVADAQQNVADANQRVTDAQYRLVEARENVTEAERRLADAQRGTAESGSAAATAQAKYQEALAKLSPAARTVLTTLISMKEEWGAVSKTVQQAMFAPVLGQLGNLRGMLPVVENLLAKAGAAIGNIAARGIEMVSSGPWKKDFGDQAIANARYIENMGDAGLMLLDALRHITRAAEPFTSWLTGALKQGATNFRDWAKSARESGSIERFLEVTKRRLQEVWAITKNVGLTLLSWAKAAEPFTDWMNGRLKEITGRWREVAKAQESATSPLQKYLQDVKPLLSAVGRLFGDLSRSMASAASDTGNIERAIALLEALRTEILPAIGRILNELGQSGIDQAIVDAIAEILNAIATFLDSGGSTALATFVTVLAGFVEVLAGIAALPVVGDIIGGIATALAAVAAVSIVARFAGLFRLLDAFRWFVANRGNLGGALGDAARGVVGLQNAGGVGGSSPSTPRTGPGTGGIGSEVILGNQAKAQEKVGTTAREANTHVGTFSRTISGLRTAGSTAVTGLSSLSAFLGGPWGVAILAATVLIGVISSKLLDQKKEVEDTKNAFTALKNAYSDLSEGNTDNVQQLAATDEKFKAITTRAKELGLSLTDVSGALNNNGQDLNAVNTQLDQQIASYEALRIAAFDAGGPTAAIPYKKLKDDAIAFKNSINEVANAQGEANAVTDETIRLSRTYEQRLGGLTQQEAESISLSAEYGVQARALSAALDTLSSSTSTAEERSRALGVVIKNSTGEVERETEAAENFQSQLLSLSEAVEANGRSLSMKTREGLRNRDALQSAAKAAREMFLQDIASKVPMDQATKRHQDRIKELEKEAKRLGLNKTETEKLIKTYGDVPEEIKTDINTDSKGFQQAYADLLKLKVMQEALAKGLSLKQAEKEWNSRSSFLYQRPPTTGDGPGFKDGGPVYGAGTRNSDSIRAWLSNGEFVQPTDVVEHYGVPVMEALRSRKLNKAVIQEALPDGNGGYKHGGHVNCDHDHAPRFRTGGSVRVPYDVTADMTKIDKDWANQGQGGAAGDMGGSGGPGGYKWQMKVLRAAFPGLQLISGYRPGSRTLSGNRSYHSIGRAVDLAPRRDVAKWIYDNYGRKTKELITPFPEFNLHNGKKHRYTGAVWSQHNFAGGNAHDHWAFRQGGLVPPANMFGFPSMNMNSMVSPSAMPGPSSSQLSQAAQSVVNQNRGITVENLNVTNPVPERASDSLSRQVTKLAVLGDI